MFWSASYNCDHHNEPAYLEVEERELIESRDDTISIHDRGSGDEIQNLVDQEGLPCFDRHIRMVESDKCHEVLCIDQVGRGRGEDPAEARKEPGLKTEEAS